MLSFKYRLVLLTAIFSAVGLLFVACGGGGGSPGSGVVPSGAGTVAITMTDGPAENFDEINVTVVKIELVSANGHVTVYEGSKTFNLLALADESRLFAIRNAVPAGAYNKIRLTLTEIELVRKDKNGNIVETAYPKLPANGKLDLLRRGGFTGVVGETLVVQIDMLADESIHIAGTGRGKYRFRPVVFVDVMGEGEFGKFVRLHGVVEAIDNADHEFKLCGTEIPVRDHEDGGDDTSRGCIQVDVVDRTSIFATDGQPANFSDLVEGEEMTVYGKLRHEDHDDDRVEGADKKDKNDKN